MATTPTRVIHHPAKSADNLICQLDRVGRSIAECIQLGEFALHHQDDPNRVLRGLGNASTRTRSDLVTPRPVTP
jgi:hypothetical protein